MASLQRLESLSFADQIQFKEFGYGSELQTPFDSIIEAVERIVDNCANTIAVEHNNRMLTYLELDYAANVLANSLISMGLKPKQRVCLVMQRGLPLIISILAVLKTGCQYIPLDGKVTVSSAIRHVVRDTGSNFVLCLERFHQSVSDVVDSSTKIIDVDTSIEIAQFGSASTVRPRIQIQDFDGAYCIYTSGSTGPPKGVDVTHGNITNLVCNSPGDLGIRNGTYVAQLLSISFDMAQWEIFAALVNGGTLLIRMDKWNHVISRANVIISTPSILQKLMKENCSNVKVVAVAGEPCPKYLADEWAKQVTFYNCCGPTEVTIVNTMHKHVHGNELSIGSPVPNTNVYILDENELPVPIRESGLMWVGGAGVSRGYLNLPELTASRYKVDKFRNDGSLMFNTGDLCRWNADGSVAHEGRKDEQIKIKGFRVELDSVSASMEATPGVIKACAVYAQNVLWGFYSASAPIDDILEETVKSHQPYYAVPTKFIFRDTLPLTSNGKIDKRTLIGSISSKAAHMPTTDPESTTTLVLAEAEQKETQIIMTSISVPTSSASSFSLKHALPEKKGIHGLRALRHRIFTLYRRFFSIVFFANLVAGILMATFGAEGKGLKNISTAVAANLATAVLVRQDYVINFLFNIACAVPNTAPMWLRRQCAKVYHIGGLHSGCAVASTIWLVIFTVLSTIQESDAAILTISYLLVALLFSIIASAHPRFRAKFHNRFELIHRFSGWTALAFFWAQTLVVVNDSRGRQAMGPALVSSPGFWLLAIATSSIITPWVHLRKVDVRADVLSNHAVRLYFNYTTTVVGTAVRLSENPLVEWHAFATIAKPDTDEFSVLVSNAGDWTSKQINNPPTKIWVRGIPACGVLRITPLFRSIVLVATGSGIGPCLPVIYARQVPARIFWSSPHPDKNFGSEILDAVRAADSNAVIHNTKTMGRPDMVAITWRLLMESGAEAVCVISNKKLTQMIVYAMESRGVPAFGAIFDS